MLVRITGFTGDRPMVCGQHLYYNTLIKKSSLYTEHEIISKLLKLRAGNGEPFEIELSVWTDETQLSFMDDGLEFDM